MSIFGGSSFVGGGAQGVIRYQLLVDTNQATQSINGFRQNMTSVGSPVANATKNLNTFNAAMKQTTTQFAATTTPIKQSGDAMANYQKNLATTATTQKGLGTQVKDIASKYSTFAIGMGSTVSQVVNLGRQYRDLVDSQIAVDRTARKMSLAQEAVDKTTAKLNALQKKGITSGTQYENALRDQTQALSMLSIATDVHDEALEAQGDTYMNFAMTVIPTVITAVGTMGSAVKDLGLNFGGLADKFKGLGGGIKGTVMPAIAGLIGSGAGGLTGLTDKIKGIGTSATGAMGGLKGLSGALIGLGGGAVAAFIITDIVAKAQANIDKMSKVDFSKRQGTINAAFDPKQLKLQMDAIKEFDFLAKNANVSRMDILWDAVTGSNIVYDKAKAAGILDSNGKINQALKESTVNTEALSAAQKKLADDQAKLASLQKQRQTTGVKAEEDHLKAVIASDKAEIARLETQAATADALDKTTKSLTSNTAQWALQIHAFEGSIPSINLATKAYLDVHNTIAKTNPTIAKNIEQTRHQKQEQDAVAKATASLNDQLSESEQFHRLFGDAATIASEKSGVFGARIEHANVGMDSYNSAIQAGVDKYNELVTSTELGIVTENRYRESLIDVVGEQVGFAKAASMTTSELETYDKAMLNSKDALDTLAHSTIDTSDSMNAQLVAILENSAASINYTKALEDVNMNQRLVAQGFEAGMKQAEDYFNNLVKGTKQEGVFNAALASGATQLGITSSLLSFSSSKMQELIKTTYAQSQGFRTLSLESAKSTAFLKDYVLITSQVNEGMLEGTKSANDWTISMIKDTAATKANHDQKVLLAKQLGITADLTGKTTAEIETMMKAANGDTEAIKALSDAAKAAAADFVSLAQAANQRFQTVLKIKIPDADKELKKMIKDLPKDVRKDVNMELKFAGKASVANKNFQDFLKLAMTMDEGDAEAMAKKVIKDLDKGFGKGKSGEKAFPGLKAQLQAAIASGDTPAALYKIIQDYPWSGVGVNLPGAIQKDLAGVPLTPKISPPADGGTALSKGLQAQINANPLTLPISALGLGNITSNVSNIFAGIIGDKGKTQTITIDANNTAAIAKVDQVATRINDLGKIHAEIALQNRSAISVIETVAGEIDKLTKVKAEISLQNRSAISAIETVEGQIDHLTKVKASISLSNRNAINAIETTEDAINKLTKLKPYINLSNRNAISAIQTVEGEIKKLSKLTPTITVKVKYDTSAKPAGTESPTGGEVLGAERLSERTDITAAESKGFIQPRGAEGLQVNLYNYNNDRETLRTFKRELGRQRYTMGI